MKEVINRIKLGWERFQNLPVKRLHFIRNLLILLMMGDLFLVIYYLKQWTIGVFFFIMILIFITLTLLAEKIQTGAVEQPQFADKGIERRKKKKMDQTQAQEVEEEVSDIDYENPFQETLDEIDESMQDMRNQMQQALKFNIFI